MTLKEVIARRGIPFKESAGKRVQLSICCPFCVTRGESADTRFRLGINTRENWAFCFNCDWGARVAAAQKILKQLALPVPERMSTGALEDARKKETGLPEGFMLLTGAPDDMPGDPMGYLMQRGLTRKQIKRAYVGVTYKGRFSYRVLFPVIWRGDYYGVVGRAFTKGHEPKYLNSYGEKCAFNVPDVATEIILSEGVFKALRLARATSLPSAALLGHKLTDEMISQLKKTGVRKAYVWPDKDQAGTRGALDAARIMVALGWRVMLPLHPVPYADNVPIEELQTEFKSFAPYSVRLAMKLRYLATGVKA